MMGWSTERRHTRGLFADGPTTGRAVGAWCFLERQWSTTTQNGFPCLVMVAIGFPEFFDGI